MPPSKPVKSFLPRKLLVAALGVATINYVGTVACGGKTDDGSGFGSSGNPRPDDPPTSGNLPGPPPPPPPTSGNLPAPPPRDDASIEVDASSDAETSDAASDAETDQ